MGGRLRIGLVGALAAVLVVAVGAFAWDATQKDQIADGVRIGGIPVGGMSADQARRHLKHGLVRPLEKPVTVKFEDRTFTLTPAKLDFRADLDGMVDQALDASRSGGLPSRVWRYATGGEVDREIAPQVSYSSSALDAFVSSLAGQLNRDVQDATVQPSAASLNLVPGQDGVTVRTTLLRERLQAAMQTPRNRVVTVPAQRTKPRVTTDQLASKYPVYLTVDRANFQLRLWKNLKLAQTYPIAVGQQGLETPAGLYSIDDKQVNPSWHVPDSPWAGDLAGKVIPPGPDDPIKARWMGFYNGAGIHGTEETWSLGTAASHGCIRMTIPDVIALYDQVPLGTPIYVG